MECGEGSTERCGGRNAAHLTSQKRSPRSNRTSSPGSVGETRLAQTHAMNYGVGKETGVRRRERARGDEGSSSPTTSITQSTSFEPPLPRCALLDLQRSRRLRKRAKRQFPSWPRTPDRLLPRTSSRSDIAERERFSGFTVYWKGARPGGRRTNIGQVAAFSSTTDCCFLEVEGWQLKGLAVIQDSGKTLKKGQRLGDLCQVRECS